MKTLIELFDERPLQNVLATEVFRPETTVFLCPGKTAENGKLKASLKAYFERRGCGGTRLVFVPVSPLLADSIADSLRSCLETYPDCAVDISGGSDAALFAAGRVSAAAGVPVFTYSRRKNRYYDISGAPFAHDLPCDVQLCAEDCFLMAGGAMLPGRSDPDELNAHLDLIAPLFGIFDCHRKEWPGQILWFQQASQNAGGLEACLREQVTANRSRVSVNRELLHELEEAGLITDLTEGEEIRFRFASRQVRFWLRDVGSALETWVYRNCLLSGLFQDVRLSAVVSWEGTGSGPAVSNEIDVLCVRGTMPVFISCKACAVRTEALNELAILRDRFGGEGSRAAIVTSSGAGKNGSAMRRRASELRIEVIEHRDLEEERLRGRIRAFTAAGQR